MVRLSGLSLRDAANPGGDIEIVCTGLWPGEKLYEELLLDAESEATAHPLIYRAREQALPPDQLLPQIRTLQAAIERQDGEVALNCWLYWKALQAAWLQLSTSPLPCPHRRSVC